MMTQMSFTQAQLDRAEKVAQLMGQKKVLQQFRRMDDHKARKELADRLLENEDDEAAKVESRLRYYEDHTRRMEKARQRYIAHLITEGVVEATPGFLAAEFYQRPATKIRRVPNTQKQFTDRQMEIAMQSLRKSA